MEYTPPWHLKNGVLMTLYLAFRASKNWEKRIQLPEPKYQEYIFTGFQEVPLFGKFAIPENPQGTVIGTYGITGDLDNQWYLKILARKAFAKGYAVVIFDWRAHGKTAELSPTLTSDGLYEGKDFICIANQAKKLGCPSPFWLTGYSLGGQLALWGVHAGETLSKWGNNLDIKASEIGGGAVICPSLDSHRSLSYLMMDEWGRFLEKAIARELKKLAKKLAEYHPQSIDLKAIKRANSIWGFDQELVINRLGFTTVEDYYQASSPFQFLEHLQKPTFILYAADDPMFHPSIIPDLEKIALDNPSLSLVLTQYGGHVGYISRKSYQHQIGDPDRWWAWNRVLDWILSESLVYNS